VIFNYLELSDVILKEETNNLKTDESEILKELLLEPVEEALDYEKLGYGNISLPVVAKYEYKKEVNDQYDNSEHEPTQIEEVDKIIKEQAMANILGITTTNTSQDSKEHFKYWKLFNGGLAIIKYDLAFV